MRKSERFSLLLNTQEKQTLEKMAEMEGGLSMSALIRRLIRMAAAEQGVWPPSETSNQAISVFDKEVNMG